MTVVNFAFFKCLAQTNCLALSQQWSIVFTGISINNPPQSCWHLFQTVCFALTSFCVSISTVYCQYILTLFLVLDSYLSMLYIDQDVLEKEPIENVQVCQII